jgi:hypothetical protein
VHDFNFGRKECGQLKTALLGFVGCIEKQFSQRSDWPSLKPKVEKFAGQWMLLHCVFLRQYFKHLKIEDHDLKKTLRELMTVPFVRRLRAYYYAGATFIAFQQFLADLRSRGLSRMRDVRAEN